VVQSNFGVHDLFFIRGFDSLESGLVLTDGAPEPEASFYQLYNVARVEVLKGPGAFLYGGNPLSGTANLVRKKPTFGRFARLHSSYGRFANNRSTIDIGTSTEQLAFRLNGLWQKADNYRNDKDSQNLAFNPALTWRINERSTLDINLEYAASEYHADSGLPIVGGVLADVPRKRSYQTPFDLSEQTTWRLRADYEIRLGADLILRDKLYYTDLEWPSQGTLFNGVFPNALGGLDVYRSLLVLDDRQKLLGNQLELLIAKKTGSLEHQMLVGFEVSSLSDDYTLDVAGLPPLDLFAAVETAQKPFFFLPQQATAGDTRATIIAPYLVDRISFGERVQLFVGGRYDNVDFTDDLSGTERDYQQFSPMLGAVYAPQPTFSLYANMGRAFAAPSARVVGERKAEESAQFELGAKALVFDGKLSVNAALFSLDKENIAIVDDNGITQQIGDQSAQGLELELAAQLRPDWHLTASYAYLNAELTRFSEVVFVPTAEGFVPQVFDRSGNEPAFAPEHLLSLWTARDIADFTLSGSARYVGSQFIAADNAYSIDGTLLIDLGLAYRLRKTTLHLNLKNITNAEYETRGFGNTSIIPASPFTFTVGLGWSL
jgi:catecholate siderophore receptor